MRTRYLDAVIAAGRDSRSVALATELKSGAQLLLDAGRFDGDLALDDAQRAAPVAHDLTVALHRVQAAREGILLVGVNAQQFREALGVDRDAFLLEDRQDPLPAR